MFSSFASTTTPQPLLLSSGAEHAAAIVASHSHSHWSSHAQYQQQQQRSFHPTLQLPPMPLLSSASADSGARSAVGSELHSLHSTTPVGVGSELPSPSALVERAQRAAASTMWHAHESQSPVVEEVLQELATAIARVDDYCRAYLAHLEAELQLCSDSGSMPAHAGNGVGLGSRGNIAPPNPLLTSLDGILSHPSLAPGALEPVQALRGLPSLPPQASIPAMQRSVTAPEPGVRSAAAIFGRSRGPPLKRQNVTAARAQQEEGEEEEEEEEEEIPSEEDDEDDADFQPHQRSVKKSNKKSNAGGGGGSSHPTTSTRGRAIKRRTLRSDEDDGAALSDAERDEEGDGEYVDSAAAAAAARKRRARAAYNTPLTLGSDEKPRRSKLPLKAVLHLRTFFLSRVEHPFPSDSEKHSLAADCGLNFKQVSDWFTNTRKRFWRPYKDHLEEVDCALAHEAHGVCMCGEEEESAQQQQTQARSNGGRGQQKSDGSQQTKKGQLNKAAQQAALSLKGQASTEDGEDDLMELEPREHEWIKMWN